MREGPILFSAPMVRAILAGTKTQTRRIVPMVTRSYAIDYRGPAGPDIDNPACWGFEDEAGREWALAKDDCVDHVIPCKYGKPGDRLWVRETFKWDLNHKFYRADEEKPGELSSSMPWRPSIHMPRAASRITLEITGVRVERLQAISAADALAEGIVQLKDNGFGLPAGEHYHSADPRQSYLSLWEAINGPGSVEANPWVWVVEFKRVEVAHADQA